MTIRSTAVVPVLVLLLVLAGTSRAQDPVAGPEPAATTAPSADDVETIADLLRYVRAREADVESVDMDIETTGSFPDGSTFRTTGKLRVLGTTHFQSRMEFEHSSGMKSVTATVRTPDGMQMFEEDEVQGRVWIRMDADLMRRVDAASRSVGGAMPAPGSGQAESPLGSAMLEDLSGQFDLRVEEPRVVRGQRCWVVAGPARQRDSDEPDLLGLGADQVDILVRVADGAVVQMTQLAEGKPLMSVAITRLELGKAFDPSSFALQVPADVEPVDVMDHPPHAAQIRRLFEEAEARGWAGGDEPAPAEAGAAGDGSKKR